MSKKLKMSNVFLPVNLQLFAGERDVSDVQGENVDLPEEDENLEDVEDEDYFSELDEEPGEPEGEKDQEPAEPGGQSKEENKVFRNMRLKAEEQAAKKLEAEKAQLERERSEVIRLRQSLEIKQAEQYIDDMFLTPSKIWEKADEEGVSEDVARKLLLAEAQKFKQDEIAKIRARYEAIENQKKILKNDKHFTLLAPEVEKVLEQNPGLDFAAVYYHMKGMRSEELDKELEKMTVKRTIADVQDRSKRRTVPSSSGVSPANTSNLSKTILEINNYLGIDSREVSKHKRQNAHRFKI